MNFMWLIQKWAKFLFWKYGNVVADFYIDCSQDVCRKLNFVRPGALNNGHAVSNIE